MQIKISDDSHYCVKSSASANFYFKRLIKTFPFSASKICIFFEYLLKIIQMANRKLNLQTFKAVLVARDGQFENIFKSYWKDFKYFKFPSLETPSPFPQVAESTRHEKSCWKLIISTQKIEEILA